MHSDWLQHLKVEEDLNKCSRFLLHKMKMMPNMELLVDGTSPPHADVVNELERFVVSFL